MNFKPNLALKQLSPIDKDFYSRFISIAIPITLQNFMAASLNLTDNIMVGQLGDASVAAVGLANQVYFILNIVLCGVGGGASIFISQFWGSKNYENIRKITSLSLMLSLLTALIFFTPSFFASKQVLSLFSSDQGVIALGSTYLRTVCLSYLLMAFSVCFAAALRSTGNVKLPLYANVIALCINTALNYILIFGMLGLPALGVAGSAIATVIARLIESLILITVIYSGNLAVAAKPHDLIHIPPILIKRIFATSGAVITKDVVWAVGTALYMVIYARMSTESVASINIVTTVRQIAFVFFGGICNACLIMVGNQIGAGENEIAYKYAGRFLKITLVLGVVVGSLMILARPLVLSPYHVSQKVIDGTAGILIVTGVMLAPATFNTVMIVGAMRGGGDITYSIILDLVAVWVIGLPLAWIGGLMLGLSVVWVYLLINLQEVFKFVFCLKRYLSKKWINNMVHGI